MVIYRVREYLGVYYLPRARIYPHLLYAREYLGVNTRVYMNTHRVRVNTFISTAGVLTRA